jgi:membrane protein implicated in regulation of membrane protease activity
MKLVSSRVLAVIVLLVLSAPASPADRGVSIHALIQDPALYDGKVVTVVGTIAAYRERVSSGGNAYTVFRLTEGDASILVFSWNKQGRADGQRVRVTGTFSRIVQAGASPVGNQIQAYRVEGVP